MKYTAAVFIPRRRHRGQQQISSARYFLSRIVTPCGLADIPQLRKAEFIEAAEEAPLEGCFLGGVAKGRFRNQEA